MLKYLDFLKKFEDNPSVKKLFGDHANYWVNVLNGKSDFEIAKLRSCVLNVSGDAAKDIDWNITAVSVNKTLQDARNDILEKCLQSLIANETKYECKEEDYEAGIRGLMFFLAIFILLVMTFASRRNKACLSCCWGYPGPVVPVNLIDSYRNRHGYMLAFGITVTACISVLFGSYGSVVGTEGARRLQAGPNYLSMFVRISLAIFISLISYPIFVAQNMKNCLMGCILGLTYSSIWLIFELFKHAAFSETCWKEYRRIDKMQLATFQILRDIPKVLCLIALIVRFCYVLFNIIRERVAKRRNMKLQKSLMVSFVSSYSNWREDYMYIHVKNVFRKHLVQEESDENKLENASVKEKIVKFLKSRVYEIRPGFLYSTRIMVSMFVSILAVYTIAVALCAFGYVLFYKFWRTWFTEVRIRSLSADIGLSFKVVKKHVIWIAGCWWFALAITSVFYILVFLNSMMWYRRHVLMLRAGDRSFLPSSIKKGSVDCGTLINACIKYAGYQVGYSSWGYLITFVVIWLILVAFTVFLLIPIIYGTPSFVVNFIKEYWITVLVAVITVIIQGQLVMRCFLISQDSIAVNNRRALHITSYIMFYFNIFRGIVSCLLRIAYGAVLGVVFLQRLQKSTLPRSFERRDPGYLAYLGFLFVEHQHSNPVLQCFVRILLETQRKRMIQDDMVTYKRGASRYVKILTVNAIDDDRPDMEMDVVDTGIAYSRNRRYRSRNRWFLFLMLSQNPSLIKYRSRFLKRKMSKKHLVKILSTNADKKFEVQPEDEICVETVETLLTESKPPIFDDDYDEKPTTKFSLKKLRFKKKNKCGKTAREENENMESSEDDGKNQSDSETRDGGQSDLGNHNNASNDNRDDNSNKFTNERSSSEEHATAPPTPSIIVWC